MLEFSVDRDKCTMCGECVRDCPCNILEMSPEYPDIVKERQGQCIRCQHCLAVCKPGALSIMGKDPAESLLLRGNVPNDRQLETLIRG